jgi:hypothetical protein
MGLGQNDAKGYWDTVDIPRSHQQHEAHAEKPGMMLAETPLLRHRILGAAFVFVAAITNEIEDAIGGSWESLDDVICQPFDEQMDTPVGRGEQAPETPCRDDRWAPAVHLLEGFTPRIDGLEHNEPAEKQPGLTLPHTRHAPEDSSDKGRQVGQDEHRRRLGKRESVGQIALPTHHDLVHD